MYCITFHIWSKTDKTVVNPAQLDTAYIRSFPLIKMLLTIIFNISVHQRL